jgi:predicted 3-demethylubiquinone-9 3-methyltransferase (glyoxalase superfamily)
MLVDMQTITPHLWYDRQAREAAELYVSAFPGSRISGVTTLDDTPSGSVDIVEARVGGLDFTLLGAGPEFRFTPAVSFLVACETKAEVDRLWKLLSAGGSTLMELGAYPFSERYAWIADRWGLSWQLMFMGDRQWKERITPTLMFVGGVCGRAEEAIGFYASVFPDSAVGGILRYGRGEEPDRPGTVKHASFTLAGRELAAMDSAYGHEFTFNEAISFMVRCDNQAEVDRYWKELSAVPEAEQCGWLKDRYGLSWQIVPRRMDEMMGGGDAARRARVTQALLQMKKLDVATLERAYEGR